MSNIEINGASLEYTEHGSGETVVLVHGSNSDYRVWHNQVDEFARHFHTVAYSRRFHYPNAKIAEGVDYSMTEQLDDLQTFIQSLESASVHLVGHSYGAFLSLLLAIRQPEMLSSLVLIEPPVVTLFVSIPPKPQELLKLLLTRPRTAIAIIHFAITGLIPATKAAERDNLDEALQIFGSAVLGAEVFDNLSEKRREQARVNTIKAEYVGSGFLPVDAADVRHVQVPALLINGANSPAMFHRLLDYMDELLPDSERIIIPSASHIVQEDNPGALNAAVVPFIQQHLTV